jgi:hypothetical protein
MKAAGPRMHLIVAVSENMGIGKDNALPWRLKSEIKYFAQMTRNTVDPNKKESGSSLIICRIWGNYIFEKCVLNTIFHCFSQLSLKINLLK